jgi:hypothetical protein
MKHKKLLLVVFTIIFASCGGGVTVVNNAAEAVTNLASGFILIPAVY